MGLTRGFISCYQSFAPMVDIAVVHPCLPMGKIDVITYKYVIINRLMHALFHIKTVIIPRDRYRPEGFSPRVDIGRGMITVLIWEKNKINFPHRHQTYGYEWSISVEGYASETTTNLSSLDVDIFQTTLNSWAEVTSWVSREAWYRVIRVLPRYLPMDCYRCSASGVYVRARLTLLLINMW